VRRHGDQVTLNQGSDRFALLESNMPRYPLREPFVARFVVAREGSALALITTLPFGPDAELTAAELHAFAQQLEELATRLERTAPEGC
jgi:hypothetical protein